MYANFIKSLKDPENELDSIAIRLMYTRIAEQYANTGFEIIADILRIVSDDLVWDCSLSLQAI